MAKANLVTAPYQAIYGLLPDCSAANLAVKQQYINGHFLCPIWTDLRNHLINCLDISKKLYQ